MRISEIEDVTVETRNSRWRLAMGILAAVLLAEIVLYRETAMSMVSIWARSDTFAHGFLVLPISLWLIWRERRSLSGMEPRPNAWLALLLAGTGFIWLLGEMATVAPLSQFALVGMLVLAVAAVLGLRITWEMGFPLAFLLFAVPFGEFAMPQLMEWTANVTILGLRLSGVPVYREGLHFIIPSGSWSVVEACSGVRYLIASLMVGTLFAYLNYRSLRRRLIFIGVSFVVPILANWLRAYIIVILGHLSGNRLAAGIDHLIYGWLFFGIVIMAMFWIGARWREDDEQESGIRSAGVVEAQLVNYQRNLLVAALTAVVMIAVWPFAEWRIERGAKPEINELGALAPIPGWIEGAGGVPDWAPHFNNASAYTKTSYAKDGQSVGLYVAYYRNQGADRKMVSSNNALVKSSDRNWMKVAGGTRPSVIQGMPLEVRTAELRSASTDRLLVWQWYWINGRLTSSDYLAKAYTALYRLFGQGDDSAVVIVYASKGPSDNPDAALQSFLGAAGPAIERALQGALNGHD